MGEMTTGREQLALLFGVMARLDTPEKVERFLTDVCTDTEVEYMAQRVESARLLLSGATYQQVGESVKISSATLSRVNRCVKRGSGGYSVLLSEYLKNEAETKV